MASFTRHVWGWDLRLLGGWLAWCRWDGRTKLYVWLPLLGQAIWLWEGRVKERNPYDISTWGWECGRGIRYKDLGPTTDGQKGAVRKLSSGSKKGRRLSTYRKPTGNGEA